MNPYDAYVNTARMSMSDREVEATALTKAALLLQSYQQNWDAPDAESRLTEALQFNQKLWSILQASLAEPDHALPAALRQDILRLGAFIDKRIFELMASPSPQKAGIIVRINQNLAEGLRAGAPQPESPGASNETQDDEREPSAVWA